MNFLGYNIDPIPDGVKCVCGGEVYALAVLEGERTWYVCSGCHSFTWECDCRDWEEM